MARAASVEQVLKTRFKMLPFEVEWLSAFGRFFLWRWSGTWDFKDGIACTTVDVHTSVLLKSNEN